MKIAEEENNQTKPRTKESKGENMKLIKTLIVLAAAGCCSAISSQATIVIAAASATMTSGEGGPTSVTIGYEVLQFGSTYDYLYQVEPSASISDGIEAFGVSFNTTYANPTMLTSSQITGLGVTQILAPGTVDANWLPISDINLSGVNWSDSPSPNQLLTPGDQSIVFGFSSTVAPTYGGAQANDAVPPSPWSTANAGTQVPVPVPEPTTIVAGAMLLLPFGASTLRGLRRKSAV